MASGAADLDLWLVSSGTPEQPMVAQARAAQSGMDGAALRAGGWVWVGIKVTHRVSCSGLRVSLANSGDLRQRCHLALWEEGTFPPCPFSPRGSESPLNQPGCGLAEASPYFLVQ